MFTRTKSLDDNAGAQVFSNKEYFFTACPTISQIFFRKALQKFCAEYGTPDTLTFNSEKEQKNSGSYFMKIFREYDMLHHVIEPDRCNQNIVEVFIREMR